MPNAYKAQHRDTKIILPRKGYSTLLSPILLT